MLSVLKITSLEKTQQTFESLESLKSCQLWCEEYLYKLSLLGCVTCLPLRHIGPVE